MKTLQFSGERILGGHTRIKDEWYTEICRDEKGYYLSKKRNGEQYTIYYCKTYSGAWKQQQKHYKAFAV